VKPGRLSWNSVVSRLDIRCAGADGPPKRPRPLAPGQGARSGAGRLFRGREPVREPGARSGAAGSRSRAAATGPRAPFPWAGASSIRSIERADCVPPRGPARPTERPALDPAWSACRQAGLSDRTCILMTGPSQKTRTCVLIESCHRLAVAPHLGQPVVFRRLRPGRRRPGAVLASARRGPRRLRGRRQLALRTRPASPRPDAPQEVPSGPARTWIRMPVTGRTLEVRDENADRQ
jgi:hypothetical protein